MSLPSSEEKVGVWADWCRGCGMWVWSDLHAELIPYETVVKELEADTVGTSAGLGRGGGRFNPGTFPQAIYVRIKVRKRNVM